ncbi:MAG TPA: hypothetical protein VKU41_12020 [Polyangiaceae bacterium]|nr:hypothetical protein [Polyangiaceae bacterium]
MIARFANGVRALITVLGVGSLLAPAMLSACGTSSSATKTDGAPPSDGGVQLVMIVTGGGGAPTSASSGQLMAPTNPFGNSGSGSSGAASGATDDASDMDSSSGAPSGASSGASSGDTSDATTDAGDDSSLEGGSSTDGPATCGPYVAPMCGTTPCDLRSNTCCVSLSLQTQCIKGANATCPSNQATLHCSQACDCPSGTVCCGVENTIQGVVQTVCQNVPDGGFCSPHPQTSTQASGQLCKVSSECKNGEGCIYQSCVYGAMLYVCGLQSQSPFNCMPATPP